MDPEKQPDAYSNPYAEKETPENEEDREPKSSDKKPYQHR